MKLVLRPFHLFALPLTAAILVTLIWSLAGPDGTRSVRAQESKPKEARKERQPALPSEKGKPRPKPSLAPSDIMPQTLSASSPTAQAKKIKRVGSVVGLNEETMQQYILLHDHVWPEVLKRIRDSNIRNYSIFVGQLDDGNYYLFSYFEYVGNDFDADMAAMGADPVTRDWWKLTDPLQRRVAGTPVGDQWKTMKQVFHAD